MLDFCYHGTYIVNESEVSGRKALHDAKVYVAVDKYGFRYKVIEHVRLRLDTNIEHCVYDLEATKTALSKRKPCETAATTDEVAETARRNWDGLLLTVEFLLGNTCEDSIEGRKIVKIDWAAITTDAFRADWLEFVAAHPAYAADVVLTQGSEEWQLHKLLVSAEAELVDKESNNDPGYEELKKEWACAERWLMRKWQKLPAPEE